MNEEQRKQLIINEIRHWKDHRMLPEQYCDFLLSIYTEGNNESSAESKVRFTQFVPFFLSALPAISLFLYLVIYFTEMSFDLQIALGTLFLFISISTSYYLFRSRRSKVAFHLSLLMAALHVLLLSVQISTEMTSSTDVLIGIILLNCGMWIGVGKKVRLHYLTVSGIVGIGILLAVIIA